MIRVTLVCAALLIGAFQNVQAQEPSRADGWVVIPVDDYLALRLKAYPPGRPPDLPPLDATISRVEYDLRVSDQSVAGEVRLTVDVLKEGWIRVEVPDGLLVRASRLDGRPVSIIDLAPNTNGGPRRATPHVLLSRRGRAVLALDVVMPLRVAGGSETLILPASSGAVSRLALVVPRAGIDLMVNGGVLAQRAQEPEGTWIAYGRAGQPLTATWKKRTEDTRVALPLKWRGSVTELLGLGEETSPLTAMVRVEVVQGQASSIDVALVDGLVINQVSGALVADWDFRPGTLKVTFFEPLGSQTSFAVSGEARVPREGSVPIPLLRLPAAERETGGVAVEVLGAGEIGERQPRGLDPADPADLGDPVSGRASPSMVAFRFRPQDGRADRALALTVARYAPQAVLIANVEEARYDALSGEEGKTLVRARYAVRNNQRAFLDVRLPNDATLWSASVGGRPVRPGVAPGGSLLLPLQKGRTGEESPAFVVEVTYVQRGAAWNDTGRTALPLPAIDLPISRAGVVLHYSPRFSLKPEPGAFRIETDPGPFTATLRGEGTADTARAGAMAAPAASPAPTDQLVAQYRKDTAGRTVTGPLPVLVQFPEFGPSVFLASELTAESQVPVVEFSYKRETRW